MKLTQKDKRTYLTLNDQKPSKLPAYARPKPKMNWSSYSNFLEDLILLWCKVNSFSGSKVDVRGTYRNGQYHTTKATKGVADVLILAHGQFIAVEVKAGRDVQSDAQKKWQAGIEANKGIYLIAKDSSIIQTLNEWKNENQNHTDCKDCQACRGCTKHPKGDTGEESDS